MDPAFLYQPRAAGVAANEALKRQATSAVRSNKRVRQKRVCARASILSPRFISLTRC